jgi:hypothetical protein
MSNSSTQSGGIGICGCLTLIFVTLKLAEVGTVAAWSWLWVLSPLWLPIAIGLPIILIFAVFAAIVSWNERRHAMRRYMDE